MKLRLAGLLLLAVGSQLITRLLLQTPPESLQRFGGFLLVVKNYHGAFSIPWSPWLFWPLMIIVIGYVAVQAVKQWLEKDVVFFYWGLIAVGALGNVVDRLLYGAVIDYVKIFWWPVFNLSDSMIVVGVGMLFWHTYKHGKEISE
jgi:signal peptidase II